MRPGGTRRLGARRTRARRYHLVEGLVAGNHAEVAAGTLLERVHAGLQVAHLGGELAVTFAQLRVLGLLPLHRLLQTSHFAHAVFGEPDAVLQEEDEDSQRGGEPLHGPESLTDTVPGAKRFRAAPRPAVRPPAPRRRDVTASARPAVRAPPSAPARARAPDGRWRRAARVRIRARAARPPRSRARRSRP